MSLAGLSAVMFLVFARIWADEASAATLTGTIHRSLFVEAAGFLS